MTIGLLPVKLFTKAHNDTVMIFLVSSAFWFSMEYFAKRGAII